MTGFEILGRLCTISPQTHVIVITGHEDTAARILAMQIGTVAFLIKPFDDEQFLKAVHLALGRLNSKKKTAAREGASTLRVLVRHAFRYVKGFILPKWRRSLPNTL